MSSVKTDRASALRQTTILVILVFVMMGLHRFDSPMLPGHVDPTAMLALGFVILASYTVGSLVGIFKMPHITGYLIAGLIFGPSLADKLFEVFPSILPPFDQGVLDEHVIDQLDILDMLAMALIALTAGGELKLRELREGSLGIAGILSGQFIAMALLVGGAFFAVSGAIPALTIDEFAMAPGAALAVGGMLAAISYATSPAATIAVITETRSAGPMTRTILSTVVLKDVIVVVTFGICSALAAEALGFETPEGDLLFALGRDIGGSILAGLLLGSVMALYLRFVGQEVLLFLVGIIYTATFVGDHIGGGFHNHPILMFLAAGFTVANFSRSGETLIRSVERLSMPVYVVFFTLAGAKLHLHELEEVWVIALALVALRALSIVAGTRLGTAFGDAPPTTRRFGWMGFISQAGVTITLAAIMGSMLGEFGRMLETLVIGAVALNEMIGPVLLKVGLELGGEVGEAEDDEEKLLGFEFFDDDGTGDAHASGGEARVDATAPIKTSASSASLWPEESSESWAHAPSGRDLWGPTLRTETPELDSAVRALEEDLQSIVKGVSNGPLRDFRSGAELYLRDLRREFLRHHRRLSVQARAEGSRGELCTMLRSEQAELAERWRGIVLGRGARLAQHHWNPRGLVENLDELIETLPNIVPASWEKASFEPRAGARPSERIRRSSLRLRRDWYELFSSSLPPRVVDLRALGRHHLSAQATTRLEGLAALFVQADGHLIARTRSIFDAIVDGYDGLAKLAEGDEVDIEERLVDLRQGVEEELALALDEVRRIARDGTKRTANAFATGLGEIKVEVKVFDTLDLPSRKRGVSRVFRQRMKALSNLTERYEELREGGVASYNLLALELELVGLEAKVKDTLEEYASRIQNEVDRRAHQQALRVENALAESVAAVDQELAGGASGEELGATLRQITVVAEKVAADAGRVVQQLYLELLDDGKVAPLIDALNDAAASVTLSYTVPDGHISRSEMTLPMPVTTTEVPFRDTVVTRVETLVGPELLRATRSMASQVRPLSAAIQDVERSLAFHVELAAAELDVVHDESVPEEILNLLREMVVGQLDRSHSMLESFSTQSASWAEELGFGMRAGVLGALSELRGELVDGEITAASVGELRRTRSRQRARRLLAELPAALREATLQTRLALRAMLGEDRLDAWRNFLGLPEPRDAEAFSPETFAAPRATTELPLVYQRFFAPDAMEAADVLTGRESEIEGARNVLTSRADGRLRAVALVGLDGVGKSAVARAIVRGGRWKSVRNVTFEAPSGLDEIDAIFDDRQEGQLVVLDGLHWLCSMRPGGCEPLRRLVEGVIADGGKHAWLVHADLLFWRFACNVAPLADAFPEVTRLEPLDALELTNAIMQRHRMSEYEHSFDRMEGDSTIGRLLARGASSIRRPAVQYFEELHSATGGLVRDALRLWLASIRSIERGQTVRVGPVPASGYAALRKLPQDILIILYQVARQGWMNPEVQARLFRIDEGTALAQLTRLQHLGLLTEEGGNFRIAKHLRGAVVRVLSEKGWVQ